MSFSALPATLRSEPLSIVQAAEEKAIAGRTQDHLEERFFRAKEALLQAQHQKCEALYEFLQVRAELSALLEAAFPGIEKSQ